MFTRHTVVNVSDYSHAPGLVQLRVQKKGEHAAARSVTQAGVRVGLLTEHGESDIKAPACGIRHVWQRRVQRLVRE